MMNNKNFRASPILEYKNYNQDSYFQPNQFDSSTYQNTQNIQSQTSNTMLLMFCFICGQQVSRRGFTIHIRSCQKKFLKEQQKLQTKNQKHLPFPPSQFQEKLISTQLIMSLSREDVEKYNELSIKALKGEMLYKCVTCNRQFLQSEIIIHEKNCNYSPFLNNQPRSSQIMKNSPSINQVQVFAPGFSSQDFEMAEDIINPKQQLSDSYQMSDNFDEERQQQEIGEINKQKKQFSYSPKKSRLIQEYHNQLIPTKVDVRDESDFKNNSSYRPMQFSHPFQTMDKLTQSNSQCKTQDLNEYKKPMYRSSYMKEDIQIRNSVDNHQPYKEIERVPCQYCWRQFQFERITKHQEICQKQNKEKMKDKVRKSIQSCLSKSPSIDSPFNIHRQDTQSNFNFPTNQTQKSIDNANDILRSNTSPQNNQFQHKRPKRDASSVEAGLKEINLAIDKARHTIDNITINHNKIREMSQRKRSVLSNEEPLFLREKKNSFLHRQSPQIQIHQKNNLEHNIIKLNLMTQSQQIQLTSNANKSCDQIFPLAPKENKFNEETISDTSSDIPEVSSQPMESPVKTNSLPKSSISIPREETITQRKVKEVEQNQKPKLNGPNQKIAKQYKVKEIFLFSQDEISDKGNEESESQAKLLSEHISPRKEEDIASSLSKIKRVSTIEKSETALEIMKNPSNKSNESPTKLIGIKQSKDVYRGQFKTTRVPTKQKTITINLTQSNEQQNASYFNKGSKIGSISSSSSIFYKQNCHQRQNSSSANRKKLQASQILQNTINQVLTNKSVSGKTKSQLHSQQAQSLNQQQSQQAPSKNLYSQSKKIYQSYTKVSTLNISQMNNQSPNKANEKQQSNQGKTKFCTVCGWKYITCQDQYCGECGTKRL